MIFSSPIFLFAFLPVVIAIYFIINRKLQNVWLLIVSLFFYSWGEPKNILIMVSSIIVNYYLALMISKIKQDSIIQNIIFIFSILFNIGLLFIFKYTDFFISNFNVIFKSNIPLRNIALPIGISFFTFQSLSYVIDVKRKNVNVQNNLVNLGLYISFFPQLIAGPIVRYIDFDKQINFRKNSVEKFYDGSTRFIEGFSKKILVADQLASYVDKIFQLNGISALALGWEF